MNKRKLWIIGLIILICGTTIVFGGNEIDFKVAADYSTKYIWRGQVVSDRSVFDPTIALGGYGFTGFMWGNMDLTNLIPLPKWVIASILMFDYFLIWAIIRKIKNAF